MAEPRKEASAIARIERGIFLESRCEPITRGRSNHFDPKIRPESLGVADKALPPFRRRICCLVETSRERCARQGIRAKCVKSKFPQRL